MKFVKNTIKNCNNLIKRLKHRYLLEIVLDKIFHMRKFLKFTVLKYKD